jgi:hypothetical protein
MVFMASFNAELAVGFVHIWVTIVTEVKVVSYRFESGLHEGAKFFRLKHVINIIINISH